MRKRIPIYYLIIVCSFCEQTYAQPGSGPRFCNLVIHNFKEDVQTKEFSKDESNSWDNLFTRGYPGWQIFISWSNDTTNYKYRTVSLDYINVNDTTKCMELIFKGYFHYGIYYCLKDVPFTPGKFLIDVNKLFIPMEDNDETEKEYGLTGWITKSKFQIYVMIELKNWNEILVQ